MSAACCTCARVSVRDDTALDEHVRMLDGIVVDDMAAFDQQTTGTILYKCVSISIYSSHSIFH